ncbi:MAG: transcription initiation factor IIB [Nitrososphaeria archaeon]
MKEKETDSRTCPSCGSKLIVDLESGELICSKCGVVIKDHVVDERPEWKAIDLEDKQKRVRVGAPMTYLLHDEGLTTFIGDKPYGVSGKGGDFKNIKNAHSRVRVNSEERSLMQILGKIEDISKRLSLPNNVAETAAYFIHSKDVRAFLKNKGQRETAAALVYLSCRICNLNRTLKEVSEAAGLKKKDVAKYYRILAQKFSTAPIRRPTVSSYVTKAANLLSLSTKTERLALSLSSKVESSKFSHGKNPAGLAAACVYISSTLFDEPVSSEDLASSLNVTPLTIRNRVKEILQNFDIIVEVDSIK